MAMRTASSLGPQRRWVSTDRLTAGEDASRGVSNPATRPRAGNISSDARAG
jgi:hypothetical protein